MIFLAILGMCAILGINYFFYMMAKKELKDRKMIWICMLSLLLQSIVKVFRKKFGSKLYNFKPEIKSLQMESSVFDLIMIWEGRRISK